MNMELSLIEARIIGCLIEKAITTPDYYPLSLKSLTTACNQKSNREPVVDFGENEVLDGVDGLIERRLVSDESKFSSATRKYQHRFCNTEFGDLTLTSQELGIVCVLLLRGPQTAGELRTRTNRLCEFVDSKETEAVLEHMAHHHAYGPLVVKLPREPGKRECRYQLLFVDSGAAQLNADEQNPPTAPNDNATELASLRAEVDELRAQVALLTTTVAELDAKLG
ncbi:MAG: YceH family protein [Vibrio sp.]